jgi:hypothetical protein
VDSILGGDGNDTALLSERDSNDILSSIENT